MYEFLKKLASRCSWVQSVPILIRPKSLLLYYHHLGDGVFQLRRALITIHNIYIIFIINNITRTYYTTYEPRARAPLYIYCVIYPLSMMMMMMMMIMIIIILLKFVIETGGPLGGVGKRVIRDEFPAIGQNNGSRFLRNDRCYTRTREYRSFILSYIYIFIYIAIHKSDSRLW